MIDDAYWAPFPEVLTLEHVMTVTGKGKRTVWRWLHEGVIPGHQIGVSNAGTYIVYRDVLRQWMETPPEDRSGATVLPQGLLDRFGDRLEREDLMTLLGMTDRTILRWLLAGLIPSRRLGATWLVDKSEFVEMLERTSNQTSRSSGK